MLFNACLHKLFDYPVQSRPEHFDPGISDLLFYRKRFGKFQEIGAEK